MFANLVEDLSEEFDSVPPVQRTGGDMSLPSRNTIVNLLRRRRQLALGVGCRG
jgi:hypothetical protein